MSDKDNHGKEEIYSKVLRAGRRTYFFDVRSTKADDFYLTITESKKHTNPDGSSYYKKHKIYLYKEDFDQFKENLDEVTQYIFEERGTEVISETHQPDFHKKTQADEMESEHSESGNGQVKSPAAFTDVSFDDI